MNETHCKNDPYISYNTFNNPTLRQYLQEIYSKRILLHNLLEKDWILKSKRTSLGFIWILIQPIIYILLYTFIFSGIINITVDNSSYFLFLTSGYIIWNFFYQNTVLGGNILISNQQMIRKSPFPKIILNFCTTINILLEQIPLLLIFLLLVIIFQKPTLLQLLYFPLAYASIILLSIAISNILSLMTLYRRDIMMAYPFLLQIIMWFTPIFYPIKLIPERFEVLLYFNPLTGIIDILRWSVSISDRVNPLSYFSLIFSGSLFVLSIILYKNKDRFIADLV